MTARVTGKETAQVSTHPCVECGVTERNLHNAGERLCAVCEDPQKKYSGKIATPPCGIGRAPPRDEGFLLRLQSPQPASAGRGQCSGCGLVRPPDSFFFFNSLFLLGQLSQKPKMAQNRDQNSQTA